MHATRHHRRVLTVLLVTLLSLLLAAGCSRDGASSEDDASGGDAPAMTEPEPIAVGDCSTAGEQIELTELADLPRQVQQTREQLHAAAMQCNFEELGMLASGSAGFSSSLAEQGSDPAQQWRSADEQDQVLTKLARVLAGAPKQSGDGFEWRAGGTRTAIAQDGRWLSFTAGS